MAKIPTILEAGRADGILIKTDNVYNDNQKKFLSDKLEEIDDNHNTLNNIVKSLSNTVNNNKLDIENKLEAEKTRATNAENNLRETINNITANPGQVSNAENVIVNTLPNSTASNVQQALDYLYENIIYDVSARNGGVTFESLSALLNSSNLNTFIPTSVRHGGMSIRFMQSSDNKYVQFRLMSESFNTTESNWQGVDDIPTARSNNLVKSGGVDLIVKGFCPFEPHGISSQTGENDNTRPMQFRTKEYWAISGSPIISATDPNGYSLEVGTRYYDTTKTFVGYAYTDRARFVRIVVVTNIEVTQEYISGCTVVLNGKIIEKTSSAVSAEIVTFNYAKTETKGKNVQEVIENIDKTIYGFCPFEKGGISAQTGLDDDTRPYQFRSKAIYKISTDPMITAVDGNGNNLEVGVRFYNESGKYVGYAYSANAKFVRFVVISNLTNISEEYIKECTVTFNSEIIKFISSVNSSKGTSFDDKNTKIKGETVQKVIENIDATVDSEINGYFSLEQGGINPSTGVDDNTTQKQFRTKDLFPITSNPIVSATDSYGHVLDLGKRFYDENKNYIGNSYQKNAVYVKIVVNAYSTATEDYLSGCIIIINGNKLKNIIGTKFAAGVSFNDSRTELKGKNVQEVIEFVNDDKKGINPIIVSTWNVGQFGHGAGTSSIVASNYNQKVLKWNKKVRGIYADLCGMQEYNPVFGKNVDNNKCSPNDVVWDFYKYFEVFRQPEVAYYWGGNGIGSQMKLSNAQKVKYKCNEGVIAPDSTTQHLLDEVAFYTLADMQLMGVTVKVACCTIAFNASDSTDNTYQAAQYAELVEKFRNYDHVILMGDFETADDSSLSVFTSNGFNICNGGAFGWFKTCPSTNIGNGNLDNIIVKGFDIVDVKMDVNDLSDHYPLIAQLLIK